MPELQSFSDWVEIDDKLHHITVTVDRNGWHRVYIDGKEAKRRAESASFRDVLTPEQVERHYKAGTEGASDQ